MPTSNRKSLPWLMAAVLVVTSLAIALLFFVLLEAGLRLAYPDKIRESEERLQRLENLAYVFHPDYLIALRPNVEKVTPRNTENAREEIRWRTNADGFRGEPLRGGTAARIIVYGDSNIQAEFSRLENTYARKLEQYLQQSGADVEVINGGVNGSGPDQSLLRFTAQVEAYQPDLVVFHVFADNDFGDIVRNRLFALDARNEVIPTGFRTTIDEALGAGGLPWLPLVSRMAQRLRRDFDRIFARPYEVRTEFDRLIEAAEAAYDTFKRGKPRAFSNFSDHYDIDLALHPTSEAARVKAALMEAVLQRVKRTADEHGTRMLVLIQPSVIDVTKGNAFLTATYLSRFPEYRRDRLTTVIDEICARHQIDRINLFPVFMQNDPDSLYFVVDDNHWNDRGQDLAARTTADHIQAGMPTLGRR